MLEGDRLPTASTRLKAALAPRIRQLAAKTQDDATSVVVCGPEGSGRLGIAAALAVAWGKRGLWLLDLRRAEFSSNPEVSIARALRMSALLDLAWAVVGAESTRDPSEPKRSSHILQHLQEAAASAALPSVWLVSDAQTLPGLSPGMTVQVPFPNRAQRVEAWRSELGDRLQSDALEALAGQFLIAEGAIVRAAQEVHSTLSIDSEPAAIRTAAADAARRFAAVGLGALAQPETSAVRLSDVILDRESRTLIEEIASYARHRHQLADEWGFGASMSYGLGVTALFAGPPGTGKTLAATAIARELGHELYRVDLSQMVSKYIGETEKHLATVFDAAEQGEVMLLFDEADSLFGKRTQVKSSVDRYANLEVNYLLQRIERFDGLVILTTNFEAGLDDAFARRLRFRVAFPQPDEEGRRALWRALIPGAVPRRDVDLDALATTYELSGGHIKEIVLRAASLAMNDGGVLTQALLVRSADAEYRKLGKLPVDSLGRGQRRGLERER